MFRPVIRGPGGDVSGGDPRANDAVERLRILLYFPIIHTEADMGRLGETIRTEKIRRIGLARWRRAVRQVEARWADIERSLEHLLGTLTNLKVYQDGLPLCGRELEIVCDLAAAGSRNHQLLLRLRERGAMLMGTESPELLLQELRGGPASAGAGHALLVARDKFIAARIGATLGTGETGILFLGMLHDLRPLLPRDIAVQFPVGSPGNPHE